MNIEICFLIVDRFKTEFMQCLGAFENGKVLGKFLTFKIHCNIPHGKSKDDVISDFVDIVKNAVTKNMQVVFISIEKIDSVLNTSIPAVILKPIQSVSNGTYWFLLDDYLKENGYETKTCDRRFVLEAKLKPQ